MSARLMLRVLSVAACFVVLGCHPAQEEKTAAPDKAASAPAAQKPAPVVAKREYNDTARFIAGMPPEPGSALAELSMRPEWTKFAATFDKNWTKLDSTRMEPMRKWAAEQIASDSPTLFYPFSGPDFLYAVTFFPKAQTYVLAALEPVGAVPNFQEMPPEMMEQYFATVNRSLDSVLSFSFFKTDNMKVDVKQDLEGTLPLLMLFVARTGNRIEDVRPVEINPGGEVVAAGSTDPAARVSKGVEIHFKTADGIEKTLYYFSANLHNDYLKKSPFKPYMAKFENVTTFVKSASYLMHKDYFSTIRDTILDKSALVVQDDSGIPYHFFKADKWDLQLYGVYSSPIAMFKEHKEDDLAAAFKEPGKAKPLPFGIGYNWRQGQSNLLVAKKSSK